jgi:hypothetical protein
MEAVERIPIIICDLPASDSQWDNRIPRRIPLTVANLFPPGKAAFQTRGNTLLAGPATLRFRAECFTPEIVFFIHEPLHIVPFSGI